MRRQRVTCRLGNGPSGFSDVPRATLTATLDDYPWRARACVHVYNTFIQFRFTCLLAKVCVRASKPSIIILLYYAICTRDDESIGGALPHGTCLYVYTVTAGCKIKREKERKEKGKKNGSPRLDVCANGRIISNTFGGGRMVAAARAGRERVKIWIFCFIAGGAALFFFIRERHGCTARPGIGAGLRARRGTTAGAAAGLYAGNIFRYGRLTFTRTTLAPAHEPTTLFQTYLWVSPIYIFIHIYINYTCINDAHIYGTLSLFLYIVYVCLCI